MGYNFCFQNYNKKILAVNVQRCATENTISVFVPLAPTNWHDWYHFCVWNEDVKLYSNDTLEVFFRVTIAICTEQNLFIFVIFNVMKTTKALFAGVDYTYSIERDSMSEQIFICNFNKKNGASEFD